ncbi:MAG: hypothetical protein A3E25_18540 [Burkholderiales bacterium RIFCSPHIGHO2_12_FULL_69_20]|nr:MAG: hypothetical protein A3E25_18540 [Burkholderiales bacterium RIFCSPHIGHO2_12_FULL_69_20]
MPRRQCQHPLAQAVGQAGQGLGPGQAAVGLGGQTQQRTSHRVGALQQPAAAIGCGARQAHGGRPVLQQGVQPLSRGGGLVLLFGGPGHAEVAAEDAAAVEARQPAQAPAPGQGAGGGRSVQHPQVAQRALRLHARLQAAGGIVETLPEAFAAEGARHPGRRGRALRRLQLHQAVLLVGLPAPHVDQLAQHLRLHACLAQAVGVALPAPVGAAEQRAGGAQQQRQGGQPGRQHLLAGQQCRHHGRRQQGQRQHRQRGP